MPDREKVLKGLECCLKESDHLYSNPCNGCPYLAILLEEQDCIKRMNADALALLKEQDKENEKHQAVLEQYDMALALLKDLEPVRPIRKKKMVRIIHYTVCAETAAHGCWMVKSSAMSAEER